MQNVKCINILPERAKQDILTLIEEEPFLTRLYKAMRASISQTKNDSCPPGHADSESRLEIESDAYSDLAFLNHDAVAPFTVRLARELTETIREIWRDPLTLISQMSKRKSLSLEQKRRTNAGITVAIMVYVFALSAIYISYAIFHHRNVSAGDEQQLKIIHLQLPPMPVMKTLPVLKQPDEASKNQLTAPTEPPEQYKAKLTKSVPPPGAVEQTQTNLEPQTQTASVASGLNSSAEAKASAASAGSGTVSGSGTGNGTALGSGAGEEGVASAKVNYNDVFPVSSVSTRPQILGRPTPGYTEEARRAQVEGAVKLSVILNADGAVSEIRVVRGLGFGLDEKAIVAARQLQFVPAQKDGHQVSVRIFLEFKFTLL